jgi:hypothetical protein
MAGFGRHGALADAIEQGQSFYATWRKSPSAATTIGIWNDLSMAPGNPFPNYYASSPLVAATLNGDEGIRHGGPVAPLTKHLKSLMMLTTTSTALPLTAVLCDYLLYYPFVDMGTSDPQAMTNTVALPRYADGEGVQIMAVITNPPGAPSGLPFTVDYVDQDGAAKTTPVNYFGAGVVTGTLATTDRAVAGLSGPFVCLDPSSTGVRSITGFTMTAGLDVGLLSLVLVRPLATHGIRGIDAPVERDYALDFPSLPRIVDGAFLGLIACPSGSLAATAIHGTITTTWN